MPDLSDKSRESLSEQIAEIDAAEDFRQSLESITGHIEAGRGAEKHVWTLG